MAVVKQGRGKPVTLFAPGGFGDDLASRMRYASRVAGTKLGFAYEQSGYFEACARIRRQAERDAAEARALATAHAATQAIGFSRGARALVGVVADGPCPFERIALVIPPGATPAAPRCCGRGTPLNMMQLTLARSITAWLFSSP